MKIKKSIKIGIILSKNYNKFYKLKYNEWLYLDDDYSSFELIKSKLIPGTKINNLSNNFKDILSNIKGDIYNIFQKESKRKNTNVWWSGQLASRSNHATNVVRNLVYVSYTKQKLEKLANNLLIVCADVSLLKTIKGICKKQEIAFKIYLTPSDYIKEKIRIWIKPFWSVLLLLKIYLFSRITKLKFQSKNKIYSNNTKNIVIRSWLTRAAFIEKEYNDRNFKDLIDYLKKNDYQILTIPMIFNAGISLLKQYKFLLTNEHSFLLPTHIVGLGAYLSIVLLEVKRFFSKFKDNYIDDINVSEILSYENKKRSFLIDLMVLNLIYPMLRVLKRKKIIIDKFIYPFENNTPEKMFILAKQSFYPNSELIGFQHTVITSDQFSWELSKDSKKFEPLPDKLICSGNEWIKIMQRLNFPNSLLHLGPSLRFAYIRSYNIKKMSQENDKLKIAIAFPYNQNLAHEEILKVSKVIKTMDYMLYLKPHPLLDFSKLQKLINALEIKHYEFVNQTCEELFYRNDLAFEIGASVTQLEAVACGTPVIRIVPDNTFHFDPMHWMDYPIRPARTIEDIKISINIAMNLKAEELSSISNNLKNNYFNEVSYNSMGVFLEK